MRAPTDTRFGATPRVCILDLSVTQVQSIEQAGGSDAVRIGAMYS